MGSKLKSDFLFPAPSLASGAARLFDWYGQFDSYSTSTSDAEADERAILSDWTVVGDDLQFAMDQFESSQPA